MSLQRHVDDLRAVLRALGGEGRAVIGHSWGGAVAILAGLQSAIESVVAIDPVLRVVPETWWADYLDDAETLFALPRPARELSVRASLAAWHPLDVEGKLHAIARMTAAPIARLATDNHVDEGGWNILSSVEAYPKPLLILAAGPEDSVMSAADVAHAKTRGGPNVRVVSYPDQGHNLHRTAFDAFAMEVESYLSPA
jgi:pimeloyl-ACP methyl ester carboxylesterase